MIASLDIFWTAFWSSAALCFILSITYFIFIDDGGFYYQKRSAWRRFHATLALCSGGIAAVLALDYLLML